MSGPQLDESTPSIDSTPTAGVFHSQCVHCVYKLVSDWQSPGFRDFRTVTFTTGKGNLFAVRSREILTTIRGGLGREESEKECSGWSDCDHTKQPPQR